MRKNIKTLIINILDYVVAPGLVVGVFCWACLSACMNNPKADIPVDSPNIMYEDPFDGDNDFYDSDTTRIADSAFVVYDRQYNVTTIVIEGQLDQKGIDACERLIVDEEQIDHILVCSWNYNPIRIKQAEMLNNFMAEYRESIMEESNSFMFIR